MNTPGKDYTHHSWLAAAALIAVLVAVSFIPPQSVGGVKLRRANILSDLLSFDDAEAAEPAAEPALFDEEEFHIDMAAVAERIEADTTPREVQITYEWLLAQDTARRERAVPDSARFVATLTPIEDFSDSGRIQAFCDTLLNAPRPVRIAFLGDSFVEGDILTADLRERLQSAYSGGGAGFAPMASPLTAFRRTVKTQSKGWTTYNIMQRKAAPARLRENFYVSGWVSQPAAGASTRWESTDYRKRLDSCTTARVFFLSPRDSRVEVTLNDAQRREFDIAGDDAVRQIAVSAPRVRSLAFKVLSGAEDFVGYGAVFEGRGVVVDNYSVRSNNGQAMFWTNPSVNAQINAMLGYDLVVLQYGLNIMQPGVKNYTNYAGQIEKMIAYVRQCFPGAAVLVLGVSDRSVKTDAGFEPMDAIPHMLDCQRRAARNTGAAFWPTCDAMRALGGMEQFVKNGWAGKDYTHINYAGGRRVAWALFDAINAGVSEVYTEQRIASLRRRPSSTRRAGPPSTAASSRPHPPHPLTRARNDLSRNGRHHRQAPGAVCLRRLLAADFQQRAVPVPLRGIPARLQRLPPRADGPHRLRHRLLALFLLQVERHLFPAARLRRGERLLDRPGHLPGALPVDETLAGGIERRGEPRHAGVFQVHELPHRHLQPAVRTRLPAIPEHLPPGRHLVLRFPVDELHHRHLPRPAEAFV